MIIYKHSTTCSYIFSNLLCSS